jgi:hypothetical protein
MRPTTRIREKLTYATSRPRSRSGRPARAAGGPAADRRLQLTRAGADKEA